MPNEWNVYLKNRNKRRDQLTTRETVYVLYLALEIGYINTTQTQTYRKWSWKLSISIILILMDYKLENHFLRRSISRNRLTIEVSVLGEIVVFFHTPLVS